MSDYFVHESSYVDDNVEIGKGTKIWHFCHIQPGAKIGENCSLGQNVNVANNVQIGDRVRFRITYQFTKALHSKTEYFVDRHAYLPTISLLELVNPKGLGKLR